MIAAELTFYFKRYGTVSTGTLGVLDSVVGFMNTLREHTAGFLAFYKYWTGKW